jgi:ribosomal protein S18 acetylase RimI-like enzyme
VTNPRTDHQVRVEIRWLTSPPDENMSGAVADLIQDVLAAGAAIGWLVPPDPAQVHAWLTVLADLAAAGDAAIAVASVDHRLVGIGTWRRYERPTHRVNADIEKIMVATTIRGAGVGRALTVALIEAARAAGVETLTLDVRGNNHGAMRLYRSLGFVEYGRLRDFVSVGNVRWDKVLFALDLRTGDEPLRRYGDRSIGEGASR